VCLCNLVLIMPALSYNLVELWELWYFSYFYPSYSGWSPFGLHLVFVVVILLLAIMNGNFHTRLCDPCELQTFTGF
jgi:hypothetical protein